MFLFIFIKSIDGIILTKNISRKIVYGSDQFVDVRSSTLELSAFGIEFFFKKICVLSSV